MFNCYQILLFPTFLFEHVCIFMGGLCQRIGTFFQYFLQSAATNLLKFRSICFSQKKQIESGNWHFCLMLLLLSVWKANFCLNFRVFSFTPPRAIRARRCLLLAVNGKIIRAFGAMKGSTFACVIAFFYAQNCGKNLATKRRPPHFLGQKSARHCQFIVINCEELGKIHGPIECCICS